MMRWTTDLKWENGELSLILIHGVSKFKQIFQQAGKQDVFCNFQALTFMKKYI